LECKANSAGGTRMCIYLESKLGEESSGNISKLVENVWDVFELFF
jgi:hypothetical protein